MNLLAGHKYPAHTRAPLESDPLAMRFTHILKKLEIRYEYEPHIFCFSAKRKSTYRPKQFQPDFFLPEFNYHVEISKHKKVSGKKYKRQQMLEIFPTYPVAFLTAQEIHMLEKHDNRGTLTWERLITMCADYTSADHNINRHLTKRWDPDGAEHLAHSYPCNRTN